MRVGDLYGTNVVFVTSRGTRTVTGGSKRAVAGLPRSRAMWCWQKIKHYVAMSNSAAVEEKILTEISRDPIPMEEFVDVLKVRKRKGILAVEFKVSFRWYYIAMSNYLLKL